MLSRLAVLILFVAASICFTAAATRPTSYRPSRFRPFDKPFVIHSISTFREEYALRLSLVLRAHLNQHFAAVNLLEHDPISRQALVQDLRRDRNPKRFIHLGAVVPNKANMVLATYLNRPPNADGSQTFVLLSVHRAPIAATQPTSVPDVFIHGYASVSHVDDIEDQLRNTLNSSLHDSQLGHVLSIEEVFDWLSRM